MRRASRVVAAATAVTLIATPVAADDAPPGNFATPTSGDQPTSSATATSRPGTTDGLPAQVAATIDGMGGFRTNLPIPVPGAHGVEPKLGLSYTSNMGNGVVGVGWGLTAPSTIQRMSVGRGTPHYDATDLFFLDGSELWPCTSGTTSPGCQYASGEPGLIYYTTRTESYRRIAFAAATGAWIVWPGDGTRIEYGLAWLTGVRRLPYRWMVTAVIDPLGNRADYEYDTCGAVPRLEMFGGNLQSTIAKNLAGNPPGQPTAPLPPHHDNADWRDHNRLVEGQVAVAPRPSIYSVGPGTRIAAAPPITMTATADPGPIRLLPQPGVLDSYTASELRLPTVNGNFAASPPRTVDVPWAAEPETLGADAQALRYSQDPNWTEPAATQRDESPTPYDMPSMVWAGRPRWDLRGPDYTVEYLYPKRIRYGASQVDFYWEGRPDPLSYGIGDGTLGTTSCRLHAVDVRTAGPAGVLQRVRTAALAYGQSADTVRSTLATFQIFGADTILDGAGTVTNPGATAEPPVRLTGTPAGTLGDYTPEGYWRTPAAPPVALPATSQAIAFEGRVEQFSEFGATPQLTTYNLDLNGDGLEDRVEAYYRNRAAGGDIRIRLRPIFAQSGGGFVVGDEVETGIGRVIHNPIHMYATGTVGDVDGDGRQDLIWMYDYEDPSDPEPWLDTNVAVTRWLPTAGLRTTHWDGLNWPVAGRVNVRHANGTQTLFRDPVQLWVKDADGDGFDDLIVASNMSGRPDPAACATDPVACLDPLLVARTWHLVIAWSNGDGTFRRGPVIATQWPIHGEVMARNFGPRWFDVTTWQFSWESAEVFGEFPVGKHDRLFVTDMNGDGKADLTKLSNIQDGDNEKLSICSAISRTALTSELDSTPFEQVCDTPDLPGIDNHEIYIPGDTDGDGRTDLIRITPDASQVQFHSYTEPYGGGTAWIDYLTIENLFTAFQPLLSDGRRFQPKQLSKTPIRWSRNATYAADWRHEFWNNANYNLPGWTCTDHDGDGRCDLVAMARWYSPTFLAPDQLQYFEHRDVAAYRDDPRIDLQVALAVPAADGGVTYTQASEPRITSVKPFDEVSSIDLADHDGDGTADVVVWNFARATQPTATTPWKYEFDVRILRATATIYAQALPADVDGDGLTDLVRVTLHGGLLAVETWLRNTDGELTLQPRWTSAWPDLEGRGHAFRVIDLDANGRHDLVFERTRPDGTLEVTSLLSLGGGSYRRVTTTPAVPTTFRMDNRTAWHVLDTNADHRGDLVHMFVLEQPSSACPNGVQMWIDTLVGNGDGTFVPRRASVALCEPHGRSTAFQPGQIDGDGNTDLVGIWSRPDRTLFTYALLPTAGGSWRTILTDLDDVGVVVSPQGWRPMDVNADGLTDFVALTASERASLYDLRQIRLRSTGDGSFQRTSGMAMQRYATADTMTWGSADINADGRDDLIHVSRDRWGAAVVDTFVTTEAGVPLRYAFRSNTGFALGNDITRARRSDLRGRGPQGLEHVAYDRARTRLSIVQLAPKIADDRIRTVRASGGGTTSVAYTPSVEMTGLRPALRCWTPAGMAMQLATHIEIDDGRGHVTSATHDFTCPRWSVAERRMLGFESTGELRTFGVNRGALAITSAFDLGDACGARSLIRRETDASTGAFQQTSTQYVPVSTAPPFHCEAASQDATQADAGGGQVSRRTRWTYNALGRQEWTYDDGYIPQAGDEKMVHQGFVVQPARYKIVLTTDAVWAGAGGPLLAYHLTDYDPLGQVVATRTWNDATSRWQTIAFAHDAWGNVTRVTDQKGNGIEHSFDPIHHMFATGTRNDVGHATSTEWDYIHGQVARSIDVNGQVVKEQWYDALGRLALERSHGLSVTHELVALGDPWNQHVRLTTSDGSTSQWSATWFDGSDRAWHEEKQGDLVTSVYIRDTTFSDALSPAWQAGPWRAAGTANANLEEQTYDGFGRAVRTRHADGTTASTTYLANGSTAIDERGTAVTRLLDSRGEISRVRQFLGATPIDTTYTHDVLGRLVEVADAEGNIHAFHYDSAGRVIHIDDPDRGSVDRTYDDAGNLVSETDAIATRFYEYDRANRKTHQFEDFSGEQATWTYDDPADPFGKGRVAMIGNPYAACPEHVYRYDVLGRVASDRWCRDGITQTTQYTYDAFSRLARVDYPDGSNVRYEFDGAGRIAAVPGVVSQLRYDPRGRMTSMTYANGATETRDYDDARGWILGEQIASAGTTRYAGTYTYFPDGRIATAFEQQQSTRPELTALTTTRSYDYDTLHRLKSVTGSATASGDGTLTGPITTGSLDEQFTYDNLGRRRTGALGVYEYAAGGSHAVSKAGAWTYAYDDVGNMIGATTGTTTRGYTWDGFGRMMSAQDQQGGVTTDAGYAYEATGYRAKKTVRTGTGPWQTTYYPNDYVEIAPSGALVAKIFLGVRQVARRSQGETTYLHADRQGSTRLVTDATGGLVESNYEYAAFGGLLLGNAAAAGDTLYTGHTRDDMTASGDDHLIFMRSRTFDPILGRFLSADTILPDAYNPASLDPYAYAFNDPIGNVDPSGHVPEQAGTDETDPKMRDPESLSPATLELLHQLDTMAPSAEVRPPNERKGSQEAQKRYREKWSSGFDRATGRGMKGFVVLDVEYTDRTIRESSEDNEHTYNAVHIRLGKDSLAAIAKADVVIVVGHGGPGILQTILGDMSGEDLGKLLANAGFKGRIVILDTCNGGTEPPFYGPSTAGGAYAALGGRATVMAPVANDLKGIWTSAFGEASGTIKGPMHLPGAIYDGGWLTLRGGR